MYWIVKASYANDVIGMNVDSRAVARLQHEIKVYTSLLADVSKFLDSRKNPRSKFLLNIPSLVSLKWQPTLHFYSCSQFWVGAGLVVMGRDSQWGGDCGFKSRTVDCVDYITVLVVKIVLFVGKGAKINEKETGVGPLKNIKTKSLLRVTKELTFD